MMLPPLSSPFTRAWSGSSCMGSRCSIFSVQLFNSVRFTASRAGLSSGKPSPGAVRLMRPEKQGHSTFFFLLVALVGNTSCILHGRREYPATRSRVLEMWFSIDLMRSCMLLLAALNCIDQNNV
jgi:hypothetical protein